ncbi:MULTISPECIES: metal-sensitive transcriptional regulator [Dehalobacter]|jgi:DNA-binding FrmR family transcriptional regulator|uniref:Metal-sensing transcriptional repressor n=2 Tax=Dehalobacter restrictus TaxID=55583 RepID=A0A857DJU7_9FIRM|nr:MULTISPECIES: metal-sensitive transcriptional regulator [Dehalobacter]AHF10137.1 copper-sensing transcriptional repressor CsoR [Dehalobacter restrictus DSM 9455]MCG1025026.1 metal-sensitive transcriptional regulator [Dehalobacter sp.]MDJ0305719.1 metal-sensitive transcriptional regulator [Dehalobacter sp.]OCZ52590.1 CsoR family transcriptional regulator [Dehalobacter sp. TeCB1]QHA00739.1 metal-sensing transcriptional repressor [Dehalobacter restrictus]
MEPKKKSGPGNDIMIRLKRIEGQVKGLQRMLDEEKCCSDILVQVAAVKAAINKVGIMIFEEHSRTCLKGALEAENDKALDDLIDMMNRFVH